MKCRTSVWSKSLHDTGRPLQRRIISGVIVALSIRNLTSMSRHSDLNDSCFQLVQRSPVQAHSLPLMVKLVSNDHVACSDNALHYFSAVVGMHIQNDALLARSCLSGPIDH